MQTRPNPSTALVIACFLATYAMSPTLGVSIADAAAPARYPCEPGLIEVTFTPGSQVRLRAGSLTDLATPALGGVEATLAGTSHTWQRLSPVSEETVDELRARGIANTGNFDLPDLNNVYRLAVTIEDGSIWDLAAALESLDGVTIARPVPLPVALPVPGAFAQEYRAPAAWNPSGTGNDYFDAAPNGAGAGVHICDLEYSWNYDHADISKALTSQINSNVADPFNDDDHGTAVAGILCADDNGWGVTGLCHDANFRTCGTYFGTPPSWNPAGAILLASAMTPPGSVLLLEQQWDYGDPNTAGPDYVPLELYGDTYPSAQSTNSVYAAIQLAAANFHYVVEAAGNGNYDLNTIVFAGDSGGIVVGAGGAYPGGFGNAGNLERLSFSSHGFRVDVQGWGENVVTTGYGDLYLEGITNDFDYTSTFSGTSSASAHVAAVIACYSAFVTPAQGALPATVMRDRLELSGTPQSFGNPGYIGPRPDLMRLYVYDAPPIIAGGGDFGDAPDGVLAYPSNGVIGLFPTVFEPNTNLSDAMYHSGGLQLGLGATLDYEYAGNGGLAFGNWFAYDADECFDPGAPFPDDGLLAPTAYTIQGGAVVPCSASSGDLGPACGTAQWGPDLDILVRNQLTTDAWLSILIDWNQDGTWGGVDANCGTPAPELAAANIPVPPTFGQTVPLSQLVAGLAPIAIGATNGYVWARFTLTDVPLPNPAAWTGSVGSGGFGSYPLGETEDYLLHVGSGPVAAPESGVAPTPPSAFPNPFRSETSIRFATARAGDVSIDVFDVRGRRIRTLVAGALAAGNHDARWDATDDRGHPVSPGVYFARVHGPESRHVVRIALVR